VGIVETPRQELIVITLLSPNLRIVATPAQIERAQEALLRYCTGTYSQDDGATTFQGNSLSYIVMALRDEGFRVPSNHSDQREFFAALGFKIVRARGERVYAGGKRGFGVPCDCVTI